MHPLLPVVIAYLLGSLSFAILSAKVFNLPDPRTFGSGNPGATNMMRSGKKWAALMTLLGDGAKGWVAVALAQWLLPGAAPGYYALAGLAAFLGHLYPVFFRFQGGKGVATALGVILAVSPPLALTCLAVWLLAFVTSRISSLAALSAALAAPIASMVFVKDDATIVAVMYVLALLLFWRHRSNIRKLLNGEEGGFGRRN